MALFFSSLFAGEGELVLEGRIYRAGTRKQELLYIQRGFVRRENGTLRLSHIYYSAAGEEVAYERVFLEGDEILSYEAGFPLLEQYGSLVPRGDGAILRFADGENRKSRRLSDWEGLIPGPLLPSFLEENKERLFRGESLEFLLPYFERRVLVPFKMIPREEAPQSDAQTLLLQMKLKNLLLGLFIRPVDFLMDRESGRISAVYGPTILPDPKREGRKSFIRAEIDYVYIGESP